MVKERRRRVVLWLHATLSCRAGAEAIVVERNDTLPVGYAAGRLTARPGGEVTPGLLPGEHRSEAAAGWTGVLLVPAAAATRRLAPLMVSLHGAGSKGERMINRWRETAEAAGVVVLAPDSGSATWDVLRGGFGPDVASIDRALAFVFDALPIDPERILIEGFSDGASYGLSIGIANGDLFTHVLGNSPGFCWPPSVVGRPRILLTHGTEDTVLPIDATSRMLAPQLDRAGYDVTFHEFAGGHVLTPEIMRLSLEWAGIIETGPPGDTGVP